MRCSRKNAAGEHPNRAVELKKALNGFMWCDRCQSDVPTESGSPSGGPRCQQCGTLLVDPVKQNEAIRNARAILERWQSSDLLDQIRTTEKIPPLVWKSESSTPQASKVPQSSRTESPIPSASVPQAIAASPAPETTNDPPPDSSGIRYKTWQPRREARPHNAGSSEPTNSDSETKRIPPLPIVVSDENQPSPERPSPGQAEQQPPETRQAEIKQAASHRVAPEGGPKLEAIADAANTTAADRKPSEGRPIFFGVTQVMASPVDSASHLTPPAAAPPAVASPAAEASAGVTGVLAANSAASTDPAPSETDAEAIVPSAQAEAPVVRIQRPPLRRPPLTRRSGHPSPATEEESGTATVNFTKKNDQPVPPETNVSAESGPTANGRTAAATGTEPAAAETAKRIVSNSRPADAARRIRIDQGESTAQLTETAGTRTRTHGKSQRRYIDEAHSSGIPGPHFEVSVPKRSNLTAMTGQFLAYLGVLGLTIGTAIVIYGHFGGYSEYTPTGWLVTTVAQMLLFLGVINLVSGGIEQTNDDVSRRINSLSEQLLRIEQATDQALRGPRLPARLYADAEKDADAEHADSERESVDSSDRYDRRQHLQQQER